MGKAGPLAAKEAEGLLQVPCTSCPHPGTSGLHPSMLLSVCEVFSPPSAAFSPGRVTGASGLESLTLAAGALAFSCVCPRGRPLRGAG